MLLLRISFTTLEISQSAIENMQLIGLDESHRQSWNELVPRTPESGFMQSWEWSLFKQAEGQQILRLGILDDSHDLLGGAIVYCSGSHAPYLMPQGPVLPWQNEDKAKYCFDLIYHELGRIAEKTHSPIIRIEPLLQEMPLWMPHAVRAPLDLIPTPTLVIDLGKPEDELLSAMHPKGRYNIRLAMKKGVEVVCRNDEQAVDDFYFLFELTYRRHDFFGEPKRFFANMSRFLPSHVSFPISQSAMRMYFAYYQGMLLASAVVIFFGNTATFLYGGSLPFMRSVMAPYLMHWQIMRDAKAAGCRHYDFFGIAPADNPHHAYARFSKFKSQFGGKIVTTAGAHDFYLYPQLAELWINRLRAS